MQTIRFKMTGKIKVIIVILFLSLISQNVRAQFSVQAGPLWGNGIRLLTDNGRNEFGMGYHAGVITRIGFNDHIALMPSVTLARKGSYRMSSALVGFDAINQRLTYLDFCIPVKYKIGVFTLQAGIQIGYLLDGVFIYQTPEDDRVQTYIKDEMNTMDLGFVGGIGLQFNNGFGMDFLINKGFNKIYDEDPPYITDEYFEIYYGPEFNGKNFLATLNVYYLFRYQEKEMHR